MTRLNAPTMLITLGSIALIIGVVLCILHRKATGGAPGHGSAEVRKH